jgi:hypothetical protein
MRYHRNSGSNIPKIPKFSETLSVDPQYTPQNSPRNFFSMKIGGTYTHIFKEHL